MILDATSKTPLADGIRRVVTNKKINYSIIISSASEYKTQMRKTTTAVKLAFELQKDFNATKQYAMAKAEKYLEVLNINDPNATVLLLDEFGIGMEHHNWRNFLIRAVQWVLETHGHERKIVIVVSPLRSYIDKDTLKLFNMHIEIMRKDETAKHVVAKVTLLNYNDKMDKLYEKYPRARMPNGSILPVREFIIHFPTDEQMKAIFEISIDAKKELKQDLMNIAHGEMRRSEMSRKFNFNDYVDKIIASPDDYITERAGRKYINEATIMVKFDGIGNKRAKQIKMAAEEKLGIGWK